MLKRIFALIIFILILPFFFLLWLIVKLDSRGSFIFKQKRAGKNKKPFLMYKIRTMIVGAERLKSKIYYLNEADGPVFKIRNDPRYTKVGKLLSHTGLDELPQLINIIKGEMDFVGPRPLPLDEAKKVPKKFNKRFFVLPGMTSLWILNGSHKLKFNQWMKLDIEYVKSKNLIYDIKISLKTIIFIFKLIVDKIRKNDC